MSKKLSFLLFAGILSLIYFQSGCVTKITSKVGSDPKDVKKISGLKYYVGKDLLLLNIKKTTASNRKITEALEIKESENIEYEGKVSVQTIPDMDFPLTLYNKSGFMSASKFKIELNENGIVKSINVESVGEGGGIIKNVFRIAGVVASFVSPTSIPFLAISSIGTARAGAAASPAAMPKGKKKSKEQIEVEACHNEIAFSQFDNIDNFKSLAKELRLFLQCDQRGCDLWKEMFEIEKNIGDSFKRKNELLRELPNANSGEVRTIKAEIDLINSENEKRSLLLRSKDNRFQIAFDAFMEKMSFGKQSRNEIFSGQFAIDKIPTVNELESLKCLIGCLHDGIMESTNVKDKISNISKLNINEFVISNTRKLDHCKLVNKLNDAKNEIDKIDFIQICGDCPKNCCVQKEIVKAVKNAAKKKLDYWIKYYEDLKKFETINPIMIKNFSKDLAELQILVSSVINKSIQEQIISQLGDFKEACEFFNKSGVLVFISHLSEFGKKLDSQSAKPEIKGNPVVYYRQTIPVQVSFYCLDSEGNLSKISEEKIDVLHPQMPIYHFTFSWSAFAKRTLGLMFNSKGQPMVFEQTGTSAAKDLTAALGESLKIARDEYADSLKKITEIQESQRTIKMDDLTTKIEQMKKEKELIDTQLEKEAVTSNYDLTLRQRQLAAELEVLQKEFALEKTAETGPQELELAKLKLELEQLKQELEILKIKLELGKK